MKNDLLTIGGLTVHGYGLMIGIGFIAAYLMTEYRARKYKMNTDIVFSLFLSSMVFGLLGAKLMYYLTILDQIIKDPGVSWTRGMDLWSTEGSSEVLLPDMWFAE